jgi:signal transduction histidine kinase/ligand-binding sensor domain-containing protein
LPQGENMKRRTGDGWPLHEHSAAPITSVAGARAHMRHLAPRPARLRRPCFGPLCSGPLRSGPLHSDLLHSGLLWFGLLWLALLCFGLCAPALAAPAPAAAPGSAGPILRSPVWSQPYFETISDSEYVTGSTVTALEQDAQGLLWIGTQYGLIRYDGYRYRKFAHLPGDSGSLPADHVSSLALARDGQIWVGLDNAGLARFDPGQERFERLHHQLNVTGSLASDTVWALVIEASGALWVGTDAGLDYRAPGSQHFVHFRHAPGQANSLLDDRVHSLLLDRQGQLWIGTRSGLQRLRPDRRSFETIELRLDSSQPSPASQTTHTGQSSQASASGASGPSAQSGQSGPPPQSGLTGQDVRTLFQAQDGKIWLGLREHGALWLEPGAAKPARWRHLTVQPPPPARPEPASAPPGSAARAAQHPDLRPDQHRTAQRPPPPPPPPPPPGPPPIAQGGGLSHGYIRAIAQPRADQIWLGSFGGGIDIVAASDGRLLRRVRHDQSIASTLALDSVSAMLLDKSGLLWVGSWGGGLQRYNANHSAFAILRHSPSRPESLSHANVRSVLELADGRILVGTGGNGIDILDRQYGLIGGFRADNAPDALPDPIVNALIQTPDGRLWAGSQQNGIAWHDLARPGWHATEGLPDPTVRKLFVTRAGQLWAGTGAGLARWDPASQRFQSLPEIDGSAMRHPVMAMAEDKQARLWIGSNHGLWLWTPGQRGLRAIRHQEQDSDSPASDDIKGLLVDHNNILWVSSARGLDRLQSFDGQHARFEHLSSRLGRPAQFVGANLMEDRQGKIWSGRSVIDPVKMQLLDLTRADGYDIGTTWIGSNFVTHDGLLMQGGTQGLALIDPAQFQPWRSQPPVVATTLKINGRLVPPALLSPTLNLTPDQRNFSIEFAALDFSNPARNRYRYRLQGYERDWIETDAEHRSANYGNLRPGWYTLQVGGSNRLGEWSPHELQISIRVLPAFWQTTWFIAMLLFMLVLLLAIGYRWRTAHLHERARQLQHLIDARTADILELGEIGQELTATLDTEQAFARVYRHIAERLDAHVFAIGIYQSGDKQQEDGILFVYQIENGERQPGHRVAMHEASRAAVWCVRERRGLTTGTRDELAHYLGAIPRPLVGQPMESVVYLPLLVEQQVIGCLTVQSPKQQAYDRQQFEFLRVLTSYTAIAISNSAAHGELASAHQELAGTHQELAASHKHLQDTQAQLVQSEKMASLGQLVANVAHEINTPIGAVKSSGENIIDAIEHSLTRLPQLFQRLNLAEADLFGQLILQARVTHEPLSTREERAAKRAMAEQLEQLGIANAAQRAAILVQLHAQPILPQILPLLQHVEVELILKAAQSLGAIVNNAQNINLAVSRVSKIVFALKAFTRSSQSGNMVAADLVAGMETVLAIYQSQLKRGVELVCRFDSLPPLPCLPDELHQVWINLIHNALQAMDYHGKLSIEIGQVMQEQQAMARVAISDTGCGIADEIRARIFEPFFTTRPIGEGSGLGLDIVKKIVERHQGRIEVDSTVGVGSTFTVYLPFATGQA